MSFASLLRSAPQSGKIKLKGGQTQGYVVAPVEKLSVQKYTPTLGKGSEYAVLYKNQEDQAYFEAMASENKDAGREDVTSGEGSSQMLTVEELTSIGTMPNIEDLKEEDLTQVYKNYDFTPIEPSEQLEPIHNDREKILGLIQANQVCVIKGPTGCGKSTQIPQFILDASVQRRQHCNIIVTQPRRIAAITIAQHVCNERKWEVGHLVGYQVALDKKASEDTRLLYCTTGVLLEKLISAKTLSDYTHIILDEVHEREEDMDFAMLIIKRFLRTSQSPNVKVVLMSATIDVSRFCKYFDLHIKTGRCSAPYFEVTRENKFSVQVHYLDALKSLGNLPNILEDEPGIHPETYQLVPLMIEAFNKIDAEDYKHKRSHEQKGAVLIFLPGIYQIETLYEILESKNPSNSLWLCPLHSSITRFEQDKVRQYAPEGKRKVILSTNIAESSITIPDVKYVIDFCLTKHLVADTVTGFTSLQLAWASHTNCIQREGRVGRVQDGRVYRMIPKKLYQFHLAKESMPEMQRCPLEVIVLKCKRLMEEECPLRLISGALDPPDLDNYEKTILKLKEIGALLTTCREQLDPLDGDLTFMGKVMGSLPLDIHITKLILLGHVFDVLEEAIIMGCSMSVRNIFSEPFQCRLQAYNNKLLWADSSESDAIAYLNAYKIWRHETGQGKFARGERTKEMWARRYMLQIKHLEEVAKQEDDIKRRLRFFNIQVVRDKGLPLWTSMEKPLILKLVLAGAFYPHYYLRSAQNPNAECEAVKMLSGHSPYNCVYMQNMPHPAPLYLDQVKEALKLKGVSEDVQFFHDDTRKLVLVFNPGKRSEEEEVVGGRNLHMSIPGEIAMPVYRAIKLRQLNEVINIKTFSPDEAQRELNKLSLCSVRSMQSLVSDYKPLISLNENYSTIEVCHVVDAGHFYAHLLNNTTHQYQRRIYMTLNPPVYLRPVIGDVLEDMIYAAPFKDEEEDEYSYYRAKVVKKHFVKDTLNVVVHFIDFGNSSHLTHHDLRELTDVDKQQELDEIPPCALDCVLAGVAPSVWSSQGGQWSHKANQFVTSTLQGKQWLVQIYSYLNGVASVNLFLEDNLRPSQRLPRTLNYELVKKGWAREREESYLSKMNNSKRQELQDKGTNLTGLAGDEKSVMPRSLAKNLMNLPTTRNLPYVKLKGPNSPLEMKVFSMVRSSTQREVKVEWNSVNSVLLDSDPSDPHERLLVAGSVSQSMDGRKLTLNHTTVLPNMHGLAALICLIFAPSAELRTDDKFSRYTGALCGLGKADAGSPLFAENDMEINFDVQFTNQDILDINKVRFWLNDRFCNEDSEDMSDSQIMNMKSKLRLLIISLLKQVRPTVRLCHNPSTFLWDKIPAERLLLPLPDDCPSHLLSRYIYKLHSGIDIDPKNDRSDVQDLFNKMKELDTALENGLAPRILYCDLCDAHFEYANQLRLHTKDTHHQQLVKWLLSRARDHGIVPPPASAQPRTSTN